MRKRLFALSALILLAVLVPVLIQRGETKPIVPKLVDPPHAVSEVNTGDIEAVINQVRVQNNLGTLSDNSLLDASAMARAKYLCENNIWSHDKWEVFINSYSYYKAGENLEYTGLDQTPRTIVQAWVNSPTHYVNISDPVFTEQGMGLTKCDNYQGEKQALIIVNHFGRPR